MKLEELRRRAAKRLVIVDDRNEGDCPVDLTLDHARDASTTAGDNAADLIPEPPSHPVTKQGMFGYSGAIACLAVTPDQGQQVDDGTTSPVSSTNHSVTIGLNTLLPPVGRKQTLRFWDELARKVPFRRRPILAATTLLALPENRHSTAASPNCRSLRNGRRKDGSRLAWSSCTPRPLSSDSCVLKC
jgi:hypothetical protein